MLTAPGGTPGQSISQLLARMHLGSAGAVPLRGLGHRCARQDGETRLASGSAATNIDGILRTTTVPADLRGNAATAERHTAPASNGRLDLRALVALEIRSPPTSTASRWPTNSRRGPANLGHWTIDACATSQFEQLVRACAACRLARSRALGAVTAWKTDRRRSARPGRAISPSPPRGCTSTARAPRAPRRKMGGHVTHVL